MRRYRAIIVLALCVPAVLVLALAGCGGGSTGGTSGGTGGTSTSGTSGGGVTITLQNFAFDPTNATAKVGDTVTFVNKDSVDHHVFVGSTDLGVQAPGASVTWKADKAGTYPLKCIIHPTMTGELTVQ